MALTVGGGGTGRAVSAAELASLAYHQSRNCRKNTLTDRLVDRHTAPKLAAMLHAPLSFSIKLRLHKVFTLNFLVASISKTKFSSLNMLSKFILAII